jgi:hypothetical protein
MMAALSVWACLNSAMTWTVAAAGNFGARLGAVIATGGEAAAFSFNGSATST